MHADGEADTLKIKFNRVPATSLWLPKTGDKISVSDGNARTGAMYVQESVFENGLLVLTASSVCDEMYEARFKSWENVWMHQLIDEIAKKYGYSVKKYEIPDKLHDYVAQNNQSDVYFIYDLCKAEGHRLIVYDNQFIIYDKEYLLNRPVSASIFINNDAKYEYLIQNGILYGSARCVFLPDLAAGSVTNIKTAGLRPLDGDAFIYKLRHDYIKRQTKIFFTKRVSV